MKEKEGKDCESEEYKEKGERERWGDRERKEEREVMGR
jgi:hypothetical protein